MSEMFPHNPLKFDARGLSADEQRDLYAKLLLPRMIEEKMMSQLRQGKISKWFSGLGQEAISVGVAAAMPRDKFIFPMHRNLGIFTTRRRAAGPVVCPIPRQGPRVHQGARPEFPLRQP